MGTPDVCKVVVGVAVGVHKLTPYKANFYKISRLCGAVSSLLINKSLVNSVPLLVLRRFLQRCRRIFANRLFKRLKNPWKGLLSQGYSCKSFYDLFMIAIVLSNPYHRVIVNRKSRLKFVIYTLVMFVLKDFAFLVSCSSAEELMKDINSMLSDFSSELDSMFD